MSGFPSLEATMSIESRKLTPNQQRSPAARQRRSDLQQAKKAAQKSGSDNGNRRLKLNMTPAE